MPACPWFTVTRNRDLTGRIRLRPVVERKLFRIPVVHSIFEVEESFESAQAQHTRPDDSYNYKTYTCWREIMLDDYTHPKLDWIINFRRQPFTPVAGEPRVDPAPAVLPKERVRAWVNCPICTEHGMRYEKGLITCTNLQCRSNGGNNQAGVA
jgi:hypothetical protein